MDNQHQHPQAQYYYVPPPPHPQQQDELDPDDPYAQTTNQSVGVIYPPQQHPQQQQQPQPQLPSAEGQQQQQQHHPGDPMQPHQQYLEVDHQMHNLPHPGFADNHNMPIHIQPQGRIAHPHHSHPLPLHHHGLVGIEQYQTLAHQQHHPHPQVLQHPQPHHPIVYSQPAQPGPPQQPHSQQRGVPVTPISVSIPVTATGASTVVQAPIIPSTPVHHPHPHQGPYTPITPVTPHNLEPPSSPPPISPEPPSPHHSQSSISSELSHHAPSYTTQFHTTNPGGIPGHHTPNTTPSSGAPSPSPSLSHSSRSSHHGGGGGGPQRSNSLTGIHRYHPTGTTSPTASSNASAHSLQHHLQHNRTRSLSYQGTYPPKQQDPDSDQDILDAADELNTPGTPPPMLAHAYSVMPMQVAHHGHHHSNDGARKEATRRQRIEAEQRRRDELREGYARLKDVLPVTNMKSSKVSLLERAVNHIIHLTKLTDSLQSRLAAQENEINRLRMINERIALTPPIGSLQPPPPLPEGETEKDTPVQPTSIEGSVPGVKEEYDEHHEALVRAASGGGEDDDDDDVFGP